MNFDQESNLGVRLSSHSQNKCVLDKFDRIDFQLARERASSEAVFVERIDSSGVIFGEIEGRPVQVGLCPNGDLEVEQFPDTQGKRDVLSLVLYCLNLLAQKKMKSQARKLFADAPAWLDKHFRLAVNVMTTSETKNYQDDDFNNIDELQAFWALVEVGKFQKNKIPAELLAKHVLKIYHSHSWAIQLAAMEAVVSRIKSAQSEELCLAKRPPDGPVTGVYKIRRKSAGILNYDVLLTDNQGIEISCSCKDFQKNTLRFCKHAAAVLEHWHGDEKRLQRFQKPITVGNISIRWVPETGMKEIFHPLSGIRLSVPRGVRKPSLKLLKFFDKNFQIKNNFKSNAEKESFLKSFKIIMEKFSSVLWIDPPILPLIERELKKLSWPLTFEKKKQHLFQVFKQLHIKLYPYQREGVKRALEKGKMILGDDMGLGKTVQAITWAECLLKTHTATKVLVIAPASLKSQWKREWHQVSDRDILIVDGNQDDRKRIYNGNSKVLVMNYELLLRDLALIKKLSPDAVILDEAQRIKNYSSQTARCVKQINAQFKLVLTGTPMENRIGEISSLMDWIDDFALAPTWRLNSEFTINKNGKEHGQKGVTGLNLLRAKLAPHFLRRTRAQVLTDLPQRTDSVRLVPFTAEQKVIHDEYASYVARLMAIAAKRPLTPEEHLRLMAYMTHMRIVSNALAQHDYGNIWESLRTDNAPERRIPHLSSPKLAEFRSLIEGLLSQDNVKIVVFSQWQRMLRLTHWSIQDILRREGIEAVFFTGREKQAQRNENIIRFHDDPSVRIFFASDAGGVGLNLQKAATVCINLELPWNPAVLEQRIARIHRIGQKYPICVYNLVTQDSIEERITRLVAEKKAVFSALFDGTSDQVIFDENSSFYSQIRDVVQVEELEKMSAVNPEDNEEIELAQAIEDEAQDPIEGPQDDKAESSTIVAIPLKDHRHLFEAMSSIKIERRQDGSMKIEASKESAELLAMVFQNMSQMFAKTLQ